MCSQAFSSASGFRVLLETCTGDVALAAAESKRCEIPGICSVENRLIDFAKRVATDQVVVQLDPCRLRAAGALSFNAKSTAGGSGGRTVFVDDIVGDRNGVISRHVDAAPLVVVDRIVDDVVWTAIGILEGNSIAPVGVE